MSRNDLLADLQCLVAEFAQEAKNADIASEGAVWALAKSMLEEVVKKHQTKPVKQEWGGGQGILFSTSDGGFARWEDLNSD